MFGILDREPLGSYSDQHLGFQVKSDTVHSLQLSAREQAPKCTPKSSRNWQSVFVLAFTHEATVPSRQSRMSERVWVSGYGRSWVATPILRSENSRVTASHLGVGYKLYDSEILCIMCKFLFLNLVTGEWWLMPVQRWYQMIWCYFCVNVCVCGGVVCFLLICV